MSIQTPIEPGHVDPGRNPAYTAQYLEALGLVERLHRLLLDVIKDEFERLGVLEINAVQALLIFNIGDNEVTAGELKSRGYYQGSNVSYNLKKLVEMGYMHHQRSEIDRRSVRVRLTPAALQLVIVNGHPEGWRPRPGAVPPADRPEWIEGSFRFDSYDTALRELLALAPDVEILLPEELRAAMADVGRRIARTHRSTGA